MLIEVNYREYPCIQAKQTTRGCTTVVFNNQIEFDRDTSTARQHCVGLFHTEGSHILKS